MAVVDLREELKEGNKSIFSRKLQQMITDRLEEGTDHDVHQQEGLCQLCVMPFLRGGHQMSPLRCDFDAS